MGVYSYGYKAGKKFLQKVFKPQKTTGKEVVQPFKYKPPGSKLEKVTRDLQIATQKESGKIKKYIQKMESDIEPFRRKLRQSTQKLDKKPVTESGFNKGKDMKAKGGRVGLKSGTNPFARKSNIKKIQEVFGPKKVKKKEKPKVRMMAKDGTKNKKATKFGMLSVKAGIDKDPNPTYADKIAGAKMKNKKKFI